MKRLTFRPKALEDYREWGRTDRNIYFKIESLIQDILRTTFTGLGKPEPLKHQFQGAWSRRITKEHRLIYKVTDEEVLILSRKEHT